MRILRAAVLVLCTLPCAVPKAQPPVELKVGALAYRGSEEAEEDRAATLEQLNRSVPGYRFQLVTGSKAFLTAAVAAHRLDFVITNPGHYLELKIDYSAVALATESSLDGYSSSEAVGAVVLVQDRRSDLQRLSDLRGERIAAVAPDAFGYLAARRELLERGVESGAYTSLYSGFPADGVLDELRSGRADAGVVRTCLLEKSIREGRTGRDEFRVLGRRTEAPTPCATSTRLYPGWVFARVAQTPAGLGDEVTHRLITLQPGVDDHIWNPPEDYHAVAELYRTLQVGPYAPFTALGLADLAWRQRYVLALAVSAALWWVIHAVRVAQLVRRRTRELELAHESARIQDARMEHAMRLSLMGEMASSLAHEINQPLAAILSYARGCERRLARGEEGTTLRDAIAGIAVQAERAGAIVRRMREFVRKSPGEQVLLEPTAVLRDALALFEPSAAAADVRIESRMPERAPPVRANRLQLEEVVLNLLQNAVESMEGMPDKLVRLAASHEADQFVVVVSDNGPGLTPAAREHLFEAFFTTKPTGLGLGLSLSRSIVEAHGGRLGADEAGGPPGRGASFRFYLPIAAQVDHD